MPYSALKDLIKPDGPIVSCAVGNGGFDPREVERQQEGDRVMMAAAGPEGGRTASGSLM
jgi:hypothetical protein